MRLWSRLTASSNTHGTRNYNELIGSREYVTADLEPRTSSDHCPPPYSMWDPATTSHSLNPSQRHVLIPDPASPLDHPNEPDQSRCEQGQVSIAHGRVPLSTLPHYSGTWLGPPAVYFYRNQPPDRSAVVFGGSDGAQRRVHEHGTPFDLSVLYPLPQLTGYPTTVEAISQRHHAMDPRLANRSPVALFLQPGTTSLKPLPEHLAAVLEQAVAKAWFEERGYPQGEVDKLLDGFGHVPGGVLLFVKAEHDAWARKVCERVRKYGPDWTSTFRTSGSGAEDSS